MRRFRVNIALRLTLLLLVGLGAVGSVSGQADQVAVPDLAGLTIPQAAAALHRAGLALGVPQYEAWTEGSPVGQNTISLQSPVAGQTSVPGAVVDVVVAQSPNVTLVYDENDFTIINETGADLRLDTLTFQMVEGANSASFAASRWAGGLRAGYCVQVWTVARGEPKDIAGCAGIQNWLVTARNTSEHFWTGMNGVIRFGVFQSGVQRGTCEAAPQGSEPRQCRVYLPASGQDEATDFVYFAYTTSRLIILNRSDDRWMPLRDTVVINNNPSLSIPGLGVPIGDSSLYPVASPVANLSQLAPGQCLLFTDGTNLVETDLPQPCDVVGRIDIGQDLIFWEAGFGVVSAIDQQERSCAGATDGRLTICIVPR